MNRFLLLTFSIFLFNATAIASLLESTLSASYRTSRVDKDNFQESLSFTGSFSYYFMQKSALEFSLTKGESLISIKQSSLDEKVQYLSEYEIFGLDFVLYFGTSKQRFQPYLKIGAVHVAKKVTKKAGDTPADFNSQTVVYDPTIGPSFGAGFKYYLSKRLAIKTGLNAWTGDLDETPIIWDYAGTIGISLYL